MFISLITYIVVVLHLQCALADTNGMDMSMDGAMSLASGSMLPYLHFTSGDNVLFLGWVPKSAGAMVGTCIGLFMLALVERWVAACRAVMEAHWSKRAQVLQSNTMNENETSASIKTKRTSPPFIPAHDVSRGILHIAQTTLGFFFMLTVMTFQVGFIFAIVTGLGVGEVLFGRYGSAAHLS